MDKIIYKGMKKYMVGYEDEPIGIYWAETPEEAIQECRAEISHSKLRYGFKFEVETKDRLTQKNGKIVSTMFAVEQ